MAGYTRNDTANNIADGNVISAAPLDGEFNAIQTAFGLSGGHTHDGSTTGDGGPVSKLGPSQELTQTASALTPSSNNSIDLGTSSAEFKDLYLTGVAYIDKLTVAASDGSADGVGSHLQPVTTATYDLGSSTYAFNTAFVTALNVRKNDAPVVTLTNLSTDMTATEIVGSIIWESLDTQQSGVDLAQIDAVVVDSLDDSGDDAVKLTFKTGNAEALTLAMTLQSDDIIAADDVALRSDSSVLSFGADDDVTLTHVADTALRLNAAIALQFRDSALSIASSTDGQLDIDADTEIEIVAPTVDIDASTTVTVNTATLAITGATDITGDLDVDNININGNAITSTDTNGNITITPNGDGKIVLDGLSFPIADGSADQVLKTDGSGQLSFTAVSSIQSTDVVNDTTPQLGGDLDLNSSDITGTGNINISGNATLSGNLTVNGTTTTVNTTNTLVSDSLIELGNGTTGTPANDAGIVIERGSANNAFIGFDESADKFTVGTGTFTGASTGDLSITTGTLVANIEGNITGNVTGNVTGTIQNGSSGQAYTFPSSDGSANTVLKTDGSGGLSFSSVGAAELNVTGNGTDGQALLSDGDGSMRWETISPAYPQVITIITSGNYTIPSNAQAILIRASGAGGSGAVRHDNNSAASGNDGGATTVVNSTLSIDISAAGGKGGEQPTSLDHKYSDQAASTTGDTIRGAGAQGGRPRNSEFDISAYEGLNGALVQQYVTGSSIQSETLTITYGTGGAGVSASGLTSENGQNGFVEIWVW